jgi:hypothetical protein
METRYASLLVVFGCLGSAPAALAEDGADIAWRVIKTHRLLTPQQQQCFALIERDDSTKRFVKVGVYEKHDKRCGGDPEIEHRLFDLEIDAKTGAAKWDNDADGEMRPIPKRR